MSKNTKNADFLNFEPLKKYPNIHTTPILLLIRNLHIKNYPQKKFEAKKFGPEFSKKNHL